MYVVKLNAYAKLNLTLDVLGKSGEYHSIDSLVTTVDLCDGIVVKRRKDSLVTVRMYGMGSESIPPEKNNALKAGEAFVETFGTTGADITVYKNIPMGAGLGGSSADAAGVLSALARLYEIEEKKALKQVADGLGSDTGYLLTGGFARMRGRGEEVEPLGALPTLHALMLVPKSGVSTAECYQKCDSLPLETPKTERALQLIQSGCLEWAMKLFSNGLYPAAKSLSPEVERAYMELKEFSPQAVSMTGSGSGVFAIFETRELCEWAKSRYRGKCKTLLLKTNHLEE